MIVLHPVEPAVVILSLTVVRARAGSKMPFWLRQMFPVVSLLPWRIWEKCTGVRGAAAVFLSLE